MDLWKCTLNKSIWEGQIVCVTVGCSFPTPWKGTLNKNCCTFHFMTIFMKESLDDMLVYDTDAWSLRDNKLTSALSYSVTFPTVLTAVHLVAFTAKSGMSICCHATRWRSGWRCVIFSNEIWECRRFGSVDRFTGSSRGGICTEMMRRAPSNAVLQWQSIPG